MYPDLAAAPANEQAEAGWYLQAHSGAYLCALEQEVSRDKPLAVKPSFGTKPGAIKADAGPTLPDICPLRCILAKSKYPLSLQDVLEPTRFFQAL